MASTVWIARHGNRQDFVDPNWPKTADRPYDPGLSPDGIEQARRLGERMQHEHLGAIFSSPFLRTVQTANEIAEIMDMPIFVEPGISEWHNDEWFPHAPTTLSSAELVKQFPRVDLSYTSNMRPEYPESENDAMRRSAEAAHAIANRFPEPVLLVGHGVSVAGAAAGLDRDAVIRECGLCCLFKISLRDEVWKMELCADVSHLDEVVAANRFN